jgi:hypothetical protein
MCTTSEPEPLVTVTLLRVEAASLPSERVLRFVLPLAPLETMMPPEPMVIVEVPLEGAPLMA